MKIAVQGKIIDTDNIYSISEIIEGHNYKYFEIESFNDKFLKVSIKNWEENKLTEKFEDLRKNYLSLKETKINAGQELNPDDWKEIQEFHNEIPKENERRLENMRQDIIKIWSENQSKIPTFNTKNY